MPPSFPFETNPAFGQPEVGLSYSQHEQQPAASLPNLPRLHSNAFLTPTPALTPTTHTPSVSSSILGQSGFSITQTAAWNLLALRYSETRLRRHQWEWIPKTNSFLPHYTFQPVPKITDIWIEWASGLNGFLSVRELNEGWNAKWKRDAQRIKSEYSRRKKVIDLIDRLQSKPNWNLELALRFIREVYEAGSEFKTTRALCEYLQSSKTGGFDAVIQRSNSFVN